MPTKTEKLKQVRMMMTHEVIQAVMTLKRSRDIKQNKITLQCKQISHSTEFQHCDPQHTEPDVGRIQETEPPSKVLLQGA